MRRVHRDGVGSSASKGNPMINEYIRYRIPKDRAQEFLDAYGGAKQSLELSNHCFGYELSRCTEDPEQFILRIQWDSEEGHIKGFRTSPEFQPFLKAVGPFMKSIEEMRHYELTPIQWTRSEVSVSDRKEGQPRQ